MNVFAGLPIPEPLAWLMATLAGLFALPYVAGPILVRFKHKTKRSPTLIAFDPDERPAPAAVQEFLDEAEAALWGCGFEVLGHVAMPDLVPNVKAIFVLLARPESNDNAIAVAAFAEGGSAAMKKFYVEFATDYADGFELCTNNTADESAFCPLPHKKVFQSDFLTDAEDLWRFHERATKEFGTGPKRPSPARHTALDRLREGLLREQTNQVAVGWLWYDEDAEAFRPTWKGACLMTWKLCWPVSAIRRSARRRQARRLLREWDMAEMP
ncbi:MAG TPA: hypothetical protein VF170_17790 [Planctomycetaceae bacterium]